MLIARQDTLEYLEVINKLRRDGHFQTFLKYLADTIPAIALVGTMDTKTLEEVCQLRGQIMILQDIIESATDTSTKLQILRTNIKTGGK